MGARLDPGGSGGGGSLADEASAISEINVTPFVDVVLVLLVIFVVTTPMLARNTLNVQLPKARTSDAPAARTLGVAVNRQGQILLDGGVVSLDELRRAAAEAVAAAPDTQAILSADADSRHGDLVTVMDALKGAGLSRFAVQVEKPESP